MGKTRSRHSRHYRKKRHSRHTKRRVGRRRHKSRRRHRTRRRNNKKGGADRVKEIFFNSGMKLSQLGMTAENVHLREGEYFTIQKLENHTWTEREAKITDEEFFISTTDGKSYKAYFYDKNDINEGGYIYIIAYQGGMAARHVQPNNIEWVDYTLNIHPWREWVGAKSINIKVKREDFDRFVQTLKKVD